MWCPIEERETRDNLTGHVTLEVYAVIDSTCTLSFTKRVPYIETEASDWVSKRKPQYVRVMRRALEHLLKALECL